MPANDFYDSTGYPSTGSAGSSAAARAEFDLIEAGFNKLPTLTGNGDKAVFINAGGTAMTAVTASSARTLLGLVIGTDVQAYDADLSALAGVTSAADKVPYFTGAGTASVADFTAYGRSIVAVASEAAFKALVNLEIGTDVQAQDAELSAIAGLVSAADRLPYFTGVGTAALATFTAAGRALVDDADNTAQRTTLGLGTIATQDANSVSITGGSIVGITDLAVADGGTGASDASGARTNLGLVIGTNVQAFDADLSALAALGSTGIAVRSAANTWVQRTITGTANQLTVTNGDGVAGNPTLSLPADVLIPTVLTVPNTGLHILDTDASHDLIIAAGSNLTVDRTLTITTGDAARTLDISAASVTISAFGASLIDDAAATNARTTLGLVIGTDVQAYDAELAALAGLTSAADRLPYFTGAGTAALATFTAFARTVLDDADAATARATLAAAGSGAVTASGLTMTSARLLGRETAATGAIEEITIGSGLQFNAGALEVTLAGGSVTSIDVSGGTTGLTFSGGPVTTAGTITMAGTLAVANGGTGSTTAANARTALGLAIGTNVQAWDADLDALAALAATAGMLSRTGAGAFAVRTLTAPAAGITISNGTGAAGNPTLALANDLAAVEGLAATGIVRRTAADTWSAGTTVSTAEIAANAVTDTVLRDSAAVSVIGRSAITGGDPADIAAAANDTILRRTSDSLSFGQLTVGMFPNDVVTYAKIQNVSATDRLLGRQTALAGDIEEITCTAAGRALLDDADASAQRTTLGLGALATLAAVDTAQIQDDAVTFAKFQNITTARVLGRTTALSGDVEELSAGTGIVISVGAISVNESALTLGNLGGTLAIAKGGTGATTAGDARTNLGLGALATLSTVGTSQIDNDSVTYAKIQNVSATDRILGRSTVGAGDIEEITCTAFGRSLLDDANAAAGRTTLAAAGSGAVGSSGLTMSTARLLGRTTAATGAIEEISVGANLTLAAGVLSAASSGGTVTSVDVSGGTTGLTFSGGPIVDSGTITMAGTLAIANGGTGATTAANARTALGLVIGTNVQAADATLTAFAALTIAANSLTIGTGADAFSQTSFAANTFPARASTGSLVAKTITDFGLSLVDDADASAGRTTLGLGALATLAAVDTAQIQDDAVTFAKFQNINTGIVLGRTTASTGNVEELSAGTGIVISTNAISVDAELAAISGLTSAADRLPYFTGAGTAALATFTSFARTLLDDADAATARATLEIADPGIVLLDTQVASSSSVLDFSLPTTYDEFELHLQDVAPATDGTELLGRVSTDGGASFLATAIYTSLRLTTAAASPTTVTSAGGSGGTAFNFATVLGNQANENINITIRMKRLSGSRFTWDSSGVYVSSTPDIIRTHASGHASANSVDYFRLLMTSGNIASGTVRLYGIVK